MSKFKWVTYQGGIPVPEPADYQTEQESGAILMASCYSRNGYYGCVWIVKMRQLTDMGWVIVGYTLLAGSEDTGNLWKSPDTLFDTIGEAVAEAERLWRPA